MQAFVHAVEQWTSLGIMPEVSSVMVPVNPEDPNSAMGLPVVVKDVTVHIYDQIISQVDGSMVFTHSVKSVPLNAVYAARDGAYVWAGVHPMPPVKVPAIKIEDP
eukprot:CAMPEP_0202873598 /NCGR_PEP_ID=MMETSP1391-20130828/23571_1 /ASSEMBLY_ACC=CAM_ASM_000867 /TAXON_ID=1034604 /ORGANISM="Chlamydomonas leiostraca, Strain SAG 11-49" /LENGTH=104 /DNA_ID=CAMNT_0049554849 /DNA_START=36 /DNA_END=350 /DNA_ORIENTATION=+